VSCQCLALIHILGVRKSRLRAAKWVSITQLKEWLKCSLMPSYHSPAWLVIPHNNLWGSENRAAHSSVSSPYGFWLPSSWVTLSKSFSLLWLTFFTAGSPYRVVVRM
jgi:hypothetical protein